MSEAADRAALLQALEERLLSSAGRASAETVDALLTEDFLEFGSSGQAFGKQDAMDGLAEESGDGHRYERVASDWAVRDLAEDIVLVTYRITRSDATEGSTATSLRSSIWKHQDDRWQMVFHQGTRVSADG